MPTNAGYTSRLETGQHRRLIFGGRFSHRQNHDVVGHVATAVSQFVPRQHVEAYLSGDQGGEQCSAVA